MVDILLTNDDGYRSAGYYPLLSKLSKKYQVVAVAPETERSWIGKSISAHQQLTLKKKKLEGNEVYACSGTPADCAQIGLYEFPKAKLVVSGINIGANAGQARIFSSGTIGAAMEASIDGVKAIAFSLYLPPEARRKVDFHEKKSRALFEDAAQISAKIVGIFMKNGFEKVVDLVSVNIPYGATKESAFEVAAPFKEPYGQMFHRNGNVFIHRGPALDFTSIEKGTDLDALSQGKISITPLSLELCAKDSMERLKNAIKKEW